VSKEHIIFKPCINNDGIRFGLREFKLRYSDFKHYSKLTFIGHYKGFTEYGVDLNVKNNVKLLTPNMTKFNAFIEYIDTDESNDLSDNEESNDLSDNEESNDLSDNE